MKKSILLSILSMFTLVSACSSSVDYKPKDQILKIYGPGGPHTALQKVAKEFERQNQKKIEIIFGPESKWLEEAKENADIIYNASEQAITAFLENYNFMDSNDVKPLYLHRAVIAVKKGNPKNIRNFQDLLDKNVNIVVTEGKGTYNTSGTGLWEDVAGRKGNLADIKNIRKKIVSFEQGSGASFKKFQEEDVDAWITWADWPLNNKDVAELIEIESDRVIYRDFSLVVSKNADSFANDFVEFLANSDFAKNVFAQEGWTK